MELKNQEQNEYVIRLKESIRNWKKNRTLKQKLGSFFGTGPLFLPEDLNFPQEKSGTNNFAKAIIFPNSILPLKCCAKLAGNIFNGSLLA